jgi:AI-2E family transporter/zinc-ribbon domain
VFSQALRINPLLVIFALLLGGQLYGFLGAFIALPIAAILRETTVYMRRHVRLEPWDLPSVAPDHPSFASEPSEETQPRPEPAPEPAGEDEPRCPECGAPRRAGADTCPECGTELGGADETASAAASAPQ